MLRLFSCTLWTFKINRNSNKLKSTHMGCRFSRTQLPFIVPPFDEHAYRAQWLTRLQPDAKDHKILAEVDAALHILEQASELKPIVVWSKGRWMCERHHSYGNVATQINPNGTLLELCFRILFILSGYKNAYVGLIKAQLPHTHESLLREYGKVLRLAIMSPLHYSTQFNDLTVALEETNYKIVIDTKTIHLYHGQRHVDSHSCHTKGMDAFIAQSSRVQ